MCRRIVRPHRLSPRDRVWMIFRPMSCRKAHRRPLVSRCPQPARLRIGHDDRHAACPSDRLMHRSACHIMYDPALPAAASCQLRSKDVAVSLRRNCMWAKHGTTGKDSGGGTTSGLSKEPTHSGRERRTADQHMGDNGHRSRPGPVGAAPWCDKSYDARAPDRRHR